MTLSRCDRQSLPEGCYFCFSLLTCAAFFPFLLENEEMATSFNVDAPSDFFRRGEAQREREGERDRREKKERMGRAR